MATQERINDRLEKARSSDYLRVLGYCDVSIEVNDQCNFHCAYCPYDKDQSHEFAVLDQSKAKEVMDQLAEDNALDGHLLFNVLGEPLMYSGIFDLIKYGEAKGLKTKLVTNGSLLTKKNIAGLIDARPNILKISVESLNGAVFEQLRGTTVRFDTYAKRVSSMVASAIDAGTSFGSYLQLDMLYAPSGIRNLKRMCGLESFDPGRQNIYENKTDLKNDVSDFLRPMIESGTLTGLSMGHLEFDDGAFKYEDLPLLRIAQNIAFHVKNYVRWDDIFFRKYPVGNSGRGCFIPNIGIHADGRVVLCCLDYNASTTIGNILDQSLSEIVTNPENIKIIQDLREGRFHFDACKSCQGHTTLIGKYVLGAKRQKTIGRVYQAVTNIKLNNTRQASKS